MYAKDLNKKLKQGHRQMFRHFGEYRWLYIYTLVFIVIFCFCFYWDNFYIDINNDKISFYTRYVDSNYFKVEDVKLEVIVSIIISFVTFLLAIVSLNFFRKRVKNQDKQVEHQREQVEQLVEQVVLQREQIDLQIVQRTDERFTTAINLLGSSESSARTGAIYALYHLAVDDERYRRQIAQILCSHIRSKTQEDDYQGKLKDDNHKERPSNEIQTCINLLFKQKPKSEGLYIKYAADLDKADLSHAYLVGANFRSTQCQGASFYKAQCQGAHFFNAKCQGVKFSEAQCQGANFYEAQCQGAAFSDAQCQGANFSDAQCQGTDFYNAQCQDAYFFHAQCQGANFFHAQCQGANFRRAQCQGASFFDTQCQGANFSEAQCQGAHFGRAQCQGANFSEAQCQSANFSDAQCQSANFSDAQCQGAYFFDAECQGANFFDAECQGANFSSAECQGADFLNTDLKGAYALGGVSRTKLAGRVGKDTELQNMVFVGRLEAEAITQIKAAKEYIGDNEYQKLEEIIEAHKDNETDCTVPDGIITGVLEDSEDIQAIIAKDWDKLQELQKYKY